MGPVPANIPIPLRLRVCTVGYSAFRLRYTRPYGYIFNADVSSLDEVEADFDAFLETNGVAEFEQRARHPVSPISSTARFTMARWPASVTRRPSWSRFRQRAIVSAQLQIGMILNVRLNRPPEHQERDAPVVNRFLVSSMLCYGLFVGWHYHCGSRYDSGFWRHARDHAWPQHRKVADPEAVDCTALRKFDDMIELLNRTVIDKADWNRMCGGFSLTSYAQMCQGLGC